MCIDLLDVAWLQVCIFECQLHASCCANTTRRRCSDVIRIGVACCTNYLPKNCCSTREREIVALVAQGYKNKEMAEKMFISEQTVKNHLHNIIVKLGVKNRIEAASLAEAG